MSRWSTPARVRPRWRLTWRPSEREKQGFEYGPRVEGGIAVAPRTFGRFAGQLIAPDEHSGRIFAFDRHGRTRVVSQYRFPAGGDIGVESVGFVPPGFDRRGAKTEPKLMDGVATGQIPFL